VALRVVVRASARDDLRSIFEWLEPEAGPEFARDYVRCIRDRCYALGEFPNRGRARADIAPALRTILFEHKATIAYTVGAEEVQIVRILHHGRDIGSTFSR
jgi:toxin ParE1/3/4